MSILTMADYASAAKQTIHVNKLIPTTPSVGSWASGWIDASAGSDPAVAGVVVLTGTATSAGNVPTNATAGAPSINNFSGVGYISKFEATSGGGAANFALVDRLFECGSFPWNSATVTLASQPSYSGRVPSGDYTGTLLAVEQGATSGSGPASVIITYTNQSGVGGQSTGSYTLKGTGGQNAGTTIQFVPLAAGDSGIQKVESIAFTGGSSGNINVLVLRVLARYSTITTYFSIQNPQSYVRGLEVTGMRVVYPTSCLQVIGSAGTSMTLDATIEIASA